jgi:hypothetical protein
MHVCTLLNYAATAAAAAAAAAAACVAEVCINKLIDSVREEQSSRGKLSGPLMAVAIAVPIVVACKCQQEQQELCCVL